MTALWRVQPARAARPLLGMIGLLAALLMGIEAAARLLPLRPPFVAPIDAYDYFLLKAQVLDALIAQGEQIDCLVLGSSQVLRMFDPLLFAEAYARTSGERIGCYNFGMWSLTGTASGYFAEQIIARYQPRLLIYAAGLRDFDGRQQRFTADVLDHPYARYRARQFDALGWLAANSRAALHLLGLPQWFAQQTASAAASNSGVNRAAPAFQALAAEPEAFIAQNLPARGYLPDFVYAPDYVYGAADPAAYEPNHAYAISPGDLAGYVRLLDAAQRSRTPLLIVEPPTVPDLLPRRLPTEARRAFEAQVKVLAHERGVPYWSFAGQLPLRGEDFTDDRHLSWVGSQVFSDWLGARVGTAIRAGDLASATPDGLRQPPAISGTLDPERLRLPDGLTPQAAQVVQAFTADTISADATIFMPNPPTLGAHLLVESLGYWLSAGYPLNAENAGGAAQALEWLTIFRRTADTPDLPPNARAAWDETGSPSILIAAGIDYLLYDERWLAALPPAMRATITDAAQYAVVQAWRNSALMDLQFTLAHPLQ